MTGENSAARGQWWNAVADWRNWRLPVKLAAVLAVPVLVAVGSGLVQIRGYIRSADSFASVQRVVTLRAGLDPLIANVQSERALAGARAEGEGVDVRKFKELVSLSDNSVAAVKNLMERTTTLGTVANARFRDVLVQLDGLPQLRDRVLTGGVDLAGGIAGYSVVLRALLDFDQAMTGDFGDPALSGTANALHNLAMAGEQVSWQHATVIAGISRGTLLPGERTAIEQSFTRQQDKLADFSAVATPEQQSQYKDALSGRDADTRTTLLQTVRDNPDAVGTIASADWSLGSEATLKQIGTVLRSLENELTTTASRLQDETSDRAGVAAVILLASLFVAGAVGIVVGNYLLRSLRALRTSALDVARNRLPELVDQLRKGDAAPDVEIDPVPVHTREELGQLARAFDAVHRQALDSAAEQAELRTAMRNAFTNLSRRSQGLVERQLKLMEELERQEENPEQLANLFKLDNLATRMRRNNENLMVLSGTDAARRFTRPVPLGDVLRAAGSEIEQYQRVVVQAAPQVDVVGYAAGDLVRLIAELLDNATTFSPPRSQVVVGGRTRPGGGVLIDVVDSGVGMSEDELVEANRKIAFAAFDDSAELPVSRQLGLYVVGRLAGRHGIEVVLKEQGDGLRAVVAVSGDLVRTGTSTPRSAPARPAAASAFAVPARTAGPSSGLPLPTRVAQPVNGARTATTGPQPVVPSVQLLGMPVGGQTGLTPATPPGSTGPQPGLPLPTRPAGPHHAAPDVVGADGVAPTNGVATPPRATPTSAPGSAPDGVPPTAPAPGAPTTPPVGGEEGWEPFSGTTVDPAAPETTPRHLSTWFGGGTVPPEVPRHRVPEASATEETGGLPKRRPRSNLMADRPDGPDTGAPVRRDPHATRGFLASYQTGIRQGVQESGESRPGQGREST
ncbi:hypothetical protein GCM10022243_44390 [Saccharothrix violaceirubra]|uniref:histidine kinase n=1 Tax=Saccharothrix violaceirubra TaxID=413306 RepID=A0A7W7T173_9PSEU|nr:nitrate- and nitrite sensing domain-containing protein [Saccharothrix violaceirubra]MBB4964671.1 signal transduction histidine kinase [Saccharothrix violaceirubra]